MKVTRYHHHHFAPELEYFDDPEEMRAWRSRRRLRRWGAYSQGRWGFGPTVADAREDWNRAYDFQREIFPAEFVSSMAQAREMFGRGHSVGEDTRWHGASAAEIVTDMQSAMVSIDEMREAGQEIPDTIRVVIPSPDLLRRHFGENADTSRMGIPYLEAIGVVSRPGVYEYLDPSEDDP